LFEFTFQSISRQQMFEQFARRGRIISRAVKNEKGDAFMADDRFFANKPCDPPESLRQILILHKKITIEGKIAVPPPAPARPDIFPDRARENHDVRAVFEALKQLRTILRQLSALKNRQAQTQPIVLPNRWPKHFRLPSVAG
jgi:hypothetical protein